MGSVVKYLFAFCLIEPKIHVHEVFLLAYSEHQD